jgi:hypothetical protein
MAAPSTGTKKTAVSVVVNASGRSQVLATNSNRLSAIIVNNSAGTVYLGSDNGVTGSSGIPLAAGASFNDTSSYDAWYVYNTQAATADIRVLEVQQV